MWLWTGDDIDFYPDDFIRKRYNIPLSNELTYILRYEAKGWTPMEDVLHFLRKECTVEEVLLVARHDRYFETLQRRFIRVK